MTTVPTIRPARRRLGLGEILRLRLALKVLRLGLRLHGVLPAGLRALTFRGTCRLADRLTPNL